VRGSRLYASLGAVVLVAGVLWSVPAGAASSAARALSGKATTSRITLRDKVNVGKLPTGHVEHINRTKGPTEIGNSAEIDKEPAGATAARAALAAGQLPPPVAQNSAVTRATPGFHGFSSLDHVDQRYAGDGNQFSLEPPDQGLCAGNNRIVAAVNTALAFYRRDGVQLTAGPISLNDFFGLRPSVTRATPTSPGGPPFGPFTTDPKCYFDEDTGSFFVTMAAIGQNRKTGAFNLHGNTYLAVSKTSDPTGVWFIYKIDATNATHPNCPCFGDQPLIGADANGVYISTAEYDLRPFGEHFNGPQLYAIGKKALARGRPASLVFISGLGTLSGTLQPATSPAGAYEGARNGTEYFLSGRDTLEDGSLRPGQVDEITAWALTNTASLASASPSVRLESVDVHTEVYGQPVPLRQRAGRRPIGQNVHVNEPLPRVEGNDERMNQVVFAAGRLWSGVNTVIAGEGALRTGIAWFAVRPSVSGGTLSASVADQGYVAVEDANVAYPSIGINDDGRGAMVFSLMGVRHYPSLAYATIGAGGTGKVHIAAAGNLPEDGFTCYEKFNFGQPTNCRWGDYSAAFAVPNGRIYMAGEYIPPRPRTALANWGTFVGRLHLDR
jgi:hypothetical protein